MIKVEEIKTAVTHLSSPELRDFSTWYKQFEADLWDGQIEEDIKAGKLDLAVCGCLGHHLRQEWLP